MSWECPKCVLDNISVSCDRCGCDLIDRISELKNELAQCQKEYSLGSDYTDVVKAQLAEVTLLNERQADRIAALEAELANRTEK
jgi:hypothetical protein